jgi:hypothetical protein
LSRKRGTLTLDAKHAIFQPCGGAPQLWVIDQTDGVLRQTFANEPTPLELYIEAHGERTSTPEGNAAAAAFPGAFILEEVLYASAPAETQGCNEPAPTYVVAARGNEPFWSVEVTDAKLIWRQPQDPQELVIDSPQSQDSEGTVGYVGAVEPEKPTIIQKLGPWPWRLPVMAAIVLLDYTILWGVWKIVPKARRHVSTRRQAGPES